MTRSIATIVTCLFFSHLIITATTLEHNPYLAIDISDMFNTLYNFPEQLKEGMAIGEKIHLNCRKTTFKNIIFVGMGGSAIAGDIAILLSDSITVPITVNRTYKLPQWANQDTLVILLSYSGNTEETISCMHHAIEKNCTIIGITSGGIIHSELTKRNYDVVTIPGGMMPRAAIGYLSIPTLYIMHQLGQLKGDFRRKLEKVVQELTSTRSVYANSHDSENLSYKIAQDVTRAFPLIYSEQGQTDAIGHRWRTQLAENSKLISSTHTIPEHNHNEIVCWQNSEEKSEKFGIIWLIDKNIHRQNKKRIAITSDIIKQNIAYQHILSFDGTSSIERMFKLIYLGDWISYWAAVNNNIDPTGIKNIETLKKKLRTDEYE